MFRKKIVKILDYIDELSGAIWAITGGIGVLLYLVGYQIFRIKFFNNIGLYVYMIVLVCGYTIIFNSIIRDWLNKKNK
jgi:hypothetical protein